MMEKHALTDPSIDGDSAILWSDNPENAYLTYILEREKRNKLAQGQSIDSLVGSSTLEELLSCPNKSTDSSNQQNENYTLATIEKNENYSLSTKQKEQFSSITKKLYSSPKQKSGQLPPRPPKKKQSPFSQSSKLQPQRVIDNIDEQGRWDAEVPSTPIRFAGEVSTAPPRNRPSGFVPPIIYVASPNQDSIEYVRQVSSTESSTTSYRARFFCRIVLMLSIILLLLSGSFIVIMINEKQHLAQQPNDSLLSLASGWSVLGNGGETNPPHSTTIITDQPITNTTRPSHKPSITVTNPAITPSITAFPTRTSTEFDHTYIPMDSNEATKINTEIPITQTPTNESTTTENPTEMATTSSPATAVHTIDPTSEAFPKLGLTTQPSIRQSLTPTFEPTIELSVNPTIQSSVKPTNLATLTSKLSSGASGTPKPKILSFLSDETWNELESLLNDWQ